MSIAKNLQKVSNAAAADAAGVVGDVAAEALKKTPLMDVIKAFAMKHKVPLAAGAGGLGAGIGLSALGRKNQY